ncbi:hypothetical protein GGR57DRAFT_459932 [Xylariaceae sp. FL1272]|nr:hypothetical protein GGR57DRAFT_459932 [Xylariaceae sp. FL1272]
MNVPKVGNIFDSACTGVCIALATSCVAIDNIFMRTAQHRQFASKEQSDSAALGKRCIQMKLNRHRISLTTLPIRSDRHGICVCMTARTTIKHTSSLLYEGRQRRDVSLEAADAHGLFLPEQTSIPRHLETATPDSLNNEQVSGFSAVLLKFS